MGHATDKNILNSNFDRKKVFTKHFESTKPVCFNRAFIKKQSFRGIVLSEMSLVNDEFRTIIFKGQEPSYSSLKP